VDLVIVNAGTWWSGGDGTNAIRQVPLKNEGLVTVDAGVFEHSGGGVSPGEFQIAAPARVALGTGSFDFGGSRWTGLGPARMVASATLRGAFSAENFGLEAGDLGGDFEVQGGFEWTGGRLVSANLRLGPGTHRIFGPEEKMMLNARLENAGHLTGEGGALGLFFTGYSQINVLTNTRAGVLEFLGDWHLEQRNPGGWPPVAFGFRNEGRLRKLGAGTGVIASVPLTSQGAIDIESGALHVQDQLTLGAASELTVPVTTAALRVTGRASLDGVVFARTGAGVEPIEGVPVQAIEAGSVVGMFANQTALNPGHVFAYDVSYAANGVVFSPRSTLAEPVHLANAAVAAGAFQFAVTVPQGLHVLIESSPDLREWTLEAAIEATAAPTVWTDPQGTASPERFYRTRLRP
jgi:hypothetical protein